ncbi:GNAT family N-acetyltransferase [Pseudomonas sp. GD03858]|uniref:GNAT family N-acetyltransferase n=1 Tax=unclassified Pseudomonas TaxID=196821 RepID=UPI002447FD2B|nr:MULTISPECIES: GNAT family N-acetyltransferase [unclassified Pseudomonas]MDH0647537.1 GNAT family N-acetyltransferase [Pseudomonas sp. GD03867]MDH0663980.1 GNAT family N-acetyltransferase [Pseudomonas sp. GD03858]
MATITIKEPPNCSPSEIIDFIELVKQSGEVAITGLHQRVTSANKLAFMHAGEKLISVAALKNPTKTYRSKISAASKFLLPQPIYPYELGWVFVTPSSRGKGYAFSIAKAVISAANMSGVFATSRLENQPMHHILKKLGFAPSGTIYQSDRGEHSIILFTTASGQDSQAILS